MHAVTRSKSALTGFQKAPSLGSKGGRWLDNGCPLRAEKDSTIKIGVPLQAKRGRSGRSFGDILKQPLNFVLEGAQQFPSSKGHFYEENVHFYWNFVKGTRAKAQDTVATAWLWVPWVKWRPAKACYKEQFAALNQRLDLGRSTCLCNFVHK